MSDPANNSLRKNAAGAAVRRVDYLLACACLASSMALVGSYVALSRPLLAAFPVFLLAWLRFAIGALAMPHWLKRPADEAPLDRAARGWLFLIAFFGNFLFSILMLAGMQMTSAVTAGIVMASIPAAVALFSRIFLREPLPPRIWLSVALVIAGTILAQLARPAASVPGSGAQASQSLWGPLLLLGAVLCEATYAVIGKKLAGQMDARRISALVNLWGLLLMTPLGLWQALDFDAGAVTWQSWALLAFYALAASVWTVWLWMTGLRVVPAAQSGIFTVFLPVSAALTGVAVLGESINAMQMAAFALAFAGVLLATLSHVTSPTPPHSRTETSPARGKFD